MNGIPAHGGRPRRFARANLAMLGGALIIAAIVALAVIHVPHPVSLTDMGVTTDASVAAAQPMAAGHLGHGEPAPAPADATCPACGDATSTRPQSACPLHQSDVSSSAVFGFSLARG